MKITLQISKAEIENILREKFNLNHSDEIVFSGFGIDEEQASSSFNGPIMPDGPTITFDSPCINMEQASLIFNKILSDGAGISTIKFVREKTGLGLKDAKQIADLVYYDQIDVETFVKQVESRKTFGVWL